MTTSETRIALKVLESCDVDVLHLSMPAVKKCLRHHQETVQPYTGGEISKAM